jgi:glycosyltransferase involved in cell wall biosynthesis
LTRAAEKLRHWTQAPPGPGQGVGVPRVVNPRMWPWFRSGLDRRINRALLLRQLTPVIASMPGPPVAVTTVPIVADLLGVLPVARWVYYCVDDFGHWPGLDQAALRRIEEPLIRRADTLIAASEVLRDRLSGSGRSTHLLTHGVDLDHWKARGPGTPLPQLAGLPRPLVIFWGMRDRRLDVSFLRRLASDLTVGTIVLVGPEADPDPELARMERLVSLPSLTFEDLPRLAQEASVLIMPYADLPVTRAIQPLKLKEYLACGKPAVVRDLPANRSYADALDLVDTPEAFSRAVRLRLMTGLPDWQRLARARLAGESWSEKARTFEDWVFGPGASRPGARPRRELEATPIPGR